MSYIRMKSEDVERIARECLARVDEDYERRRKMVAERVRARWTARVAAKFRGRPLTDDEAVKLAEWADWPLSDVQGDDDVAHRLLAAAQHADEVIVSAKHLEAVLP